MNQGRIWCVVHPTVGLPLLLGSVAATSLIVHASIMTHTTWMSSYWMGSRARTALNTTPSKTAMAATGNPDFSVMVMPVPATQAAPASFVITVVPKSAATATAAADAKSPAPIRSASAE